MRITLIRPRVGNSPDPPLALMMLSACAGRHGHEIQILDPHDDDDATAIRVRAFSPQLVAYSLLTTQVARAMEIQRDIKRELPGVPTAAGGIHPTALPEWTLRALTLILSSAAKAKRPLPKW